MLRTASRHSISAQRFVLLLHNGPVENYAIQGTVFRQDNGILRSDPVSCQVDSKQQLFICEVPMQYKLAVVSAFLLACSVPAGAAPGNAAAECEARNLGFDQKEVGWAHLPLSKLKRDTVYTVVQEDGHAVLRGAADASASMYVAPFKPAVGVPAAMSWRWKTDALVPGADNRDKNREDAPLRVIVAFDGDVSKLPKVEQKRFNRAKRLSGHTPPYAVLMYIWSDHVAAESVIPSAHSSQIKMLVAASGTNGLGVWQSVRRNIADDYRRAYGAEPGRLLSVAVMTDTDNTGTKAVGEYADIRLECAGG
jgi:hypothetical protein